MTTSHKPAFPFINNEDSEAPDVHYGLTKREYFAAHAPQMPEWFQIVSKLLPPKEPKWWDKYKVGDKTGPYANDILTEDDIVQMGSWTHDPSFDLPDHLQWYQDSVENWRKERGAYEHYKTVERFIAWRWYYADQMCAN